jgi:hypothetical protein
MLLLLVSWILIYTVTSLIGFGVIHLRHRKQEASVSQTEVILAGLVSIVVIVEIFSIFWPADWRVVCLLIVLAGLINWRLMNRPLAAALISLSRAGRHPLWWLLVTTVLVFSITQPASFDSGLYHIPAIRWYERFRAIPGLGNLHGRLAFNSSFFVVSAAFGLTNLWGQTAFPFNGFLLLVFGTYVLNRLKLPKMTPGLRLFHWLVLVLVLYYILYPISSPTSDVWATLLPLFVFLFWLNYKSEITPVRFFLLMAIGLFCLTVKLGTIPLLLFLPILLFTYWPSMSPQKGLVLVAVGTLVLGPWLVRNVILSGYLIYPFPTIDLFAVDWKIPLSAVHFEEDCVVFWARFHVDEAHFDPAKLAWSPARWLGIWWQDQGSPATMYYYKLNRPMFVAACLSPLLMVSQSRWVGFPPVRIWQAYGVAISGFIFWFVKAPEFRFGFAFIWMSALLPWIPLLERLSLRINRQILTWSLGVLLVFFSVKLIYQKQPVTAQTLIKPQWLGYRQLQAEGVHYQPRRTKSGLVVVIPTPPPNAFDQRCYEIDQPCTPYYFEDLEERGKTLQDGFRRASSL